MKTNQRHCHVLGGINYISNTQPSDNTFDNLRRLIFEVAEDMPSWGEHYPVRWIYLEKALERQREKGDTVIKLDDIKEIAQNSSVPITSSDEVILFLQYQHEIGNLIFFNDQSLKDCVIIQPNWLIDAFKCIVCADEFRLFSKKPRYNTLLNIKENGVITLNVLKEMFREKGVAYLGYLEYVLGVMEKYDIMFKDKLTRDTLFVQV
ncbi:unnamed protein product [Mytilus edulis]|uniref:COR domain-containing protein n=1 Tax=Mytilus edulis TaxID=6550 RepID=A0A8S3UM00_MYTED|nr:unnamed protein product [Mytilus edulis]